MSLGNIFKALAPIAAGAAFGPGGTLLAGSAGTAGSAITAGALTGAGIAALSGDDPLMGAVSGGLGGYGGAGIGEAMSGTAADAALAETATGYGAGPVQFQNFADPGKMTAVTSDMFSNPISSTVAPRGTLGSGFKASMNDPKAFLSNLGGGSTGKGAAKLGAVGLPALGQAMVPEYNANPDDDLMAKYDPKRRLNLGMTTGIQNALTRDSGLRLNQPFAQFAEGGYIEDRMYPLGPTGEFGLPRHPKFDELTDEEINYFFETDEAEVLNRMDLDQEHRERMQDYIDRYDRNFQEGGYLETGGRIGDGMSDDINATIEGGQPARLSDGEFVVPADVVSHLGNGSSDAGAEQLYTMMDRIREARTGTEEQGREIMPERFMPA